MDNYIDNSTQTSLQRLTDWSESSITIRDATTLPNSTRSSRRAALAQNNNNNNNNNKWNRFCHQYFPHFFPAAASPPPSSPSPASASPPLPTPVPPRAQYESPPALYEVGSIPPLAYIAPGDMTLPASSLAYSRFYRRPSLGEENDQHLSCKDKMGRRELISCCALDFANGVSLSTDNFSTLDNRDSVAKGLLALHVVLQSHRELLPS